MIHVTIRERDAAAKATEPITSGSVGLPVLFRFSEDWLELGKTAVFSGSGQTLDMAIPEDRCVVPHEVLRHSGGSLKIGVYGTGDGGKKVTPTVWANAGVILPGTEPTAVEESPATQTLVQQLLEEAQAAHTAAEAAKTLAKSVREDADAGSFDGAAGAKGDKGDKGDTGATGPQGPKGDPGECAGVVYYRANVDENGVLSMPSDMPTPNELKAAVAGSDALPMIRLTDRHWLNSEDKEIDRRLLIYELRYAQRHMISPSFAVFNTIVPLPATGELVYVEITGETANGTTSWAISKTPLATGGKGVFIAQYGTTSSAEVAAALGAGKLVYAEDNGALYRLAGEVGQGGVTTYQFVRGPVLMSMSFYCYQLTLAGDTWAGPTQLKIARTDSPAFTGTPEAPTAAAGTNTTQIATTAFVQDAIAENAAAVDDIKSAIDDIAEITQPKPIFIIGVYSWNPTTNSMSFGANAKRATSDLRFLNLRQGDTVGITDYDTYSIAFGDNTMGWYANGYQTHDVTANSPSILPYIILVKRNDDADMTESDIAALTAQFHSTSALKEVEFSQPALNAIDKQTAFSTKNNGYIHLSLDDVSICINSLATMPYSSAWDEPLLKALKNLHETYGAVFSLYVWDVANIAGIQSKFKAELKAASNWLKFGFHAAAEGSLATATAQEAKTWYDTFINNVFARCGGVNSVDRMPRLNYFAGNLDALKALRDCDCGCIGFLNADDSRNAYYLSADELAYSRTHSIWTDRTNGLQFVSTVMRLDWFVDGFSSEYNYNVPVQNNPYDELVYRYGQPAMADLYSGLVVFTHEWQIYNSNRVVNSAMLNMMEQVCQFARDYQYSFDYPQNRVGNITSYAVGAIVIDNFATTVHGEWSFGAVEDSGNIVSSENRIRTTPFKASKVVISFPSGYKVNVCRYNSVNADSTSFVDRTNWQTSKQSLTGDYYYVVVASTTENTASLDIADLYTITAVRNINDL